jgi:urea carboxylase
MKMEIPVYATADGKVTHVLLESGQRINAGQALVVIDENQKGL